MAPTPDKTPVAPPTPKDEMLPPPLEKLKGSPMEETVRIWARQSKAGTVTLCNKKGCYYPLTVVRDPAKAMDPKLAKDEQGKQHMVGLCSWAGEAHGEQPIYPPKKEDEI